MSGADPQATIAGAISVVVPAYNAAAILDVCVESLAAGSVRPLEIIIVDDASRDATPEVIARLAERHPDLVRGVRLQANGGPARARNEGAALARGEFIFFVDSDTKMQRDGLAAFVRRIPEADAVCGHYDWRPLNNSPVAWYKSLLNYYMFSRHGVVSHDVFLGSAGGIRADVFRAAGGYNDRLVWGMDYENEEFGHRLHAQGRRILLDPAIVVGHRFPGFAALTRTYFLRVSQWMELFLRRGRFESTGPASADVGLATIAAVLGVVSVLLVWFSPWAVVIPTAFAVLYLRGYGGFLTFVARRRPLFLPPALALNIYFSFVLAAAAAWGAVRFLFKPRHAGGSPWGIVDTGNLPRDRS